MKSDRIPYVRLPIAAWLLAMSSALSPLAAMAQASAPAPTTAASENADSANATAAGATRAGKRLPPRLLTPAETRDNAAAAGDVKPERPVTPQVSIPFGKRPSPQLTSEAKVVRRGNAASAGGIDDAAARCEAQMGEQVRVKCRDKIAREAKARSPG
jgi:hypothetical protein